MDGLGVTLTIEQEIEGRLHRWTGVPFVVTTHAVTRSPRELNWWERDSCMAVTFYGANPLREVPRPEGE